MHDVLIIGGGVIGLSLAYELSVAGAACTVIDQGALGQESSWAGAGILPPGRLEHAQTPEARLRAASHNLWPGLSAQLREETGIDNGFRRCGGIELRLDGAPDALDEEMRAWQCEGVEVRPVPGPAARTCERGLSARTQAAYHLPEMGQVRNPRHIKALIAACSQRGVQLRPGTPAFGFRREGNRIIAVETSAGPLAAGRYVVSGGAWSGRLLETAGVRVPVRPMRGQIVLLALEPCPIRQVVNVGPRYLVPRGDGRVLVGSTEEVAGFDKRTTAVGVGGLIEFGVQVVPALADATVERSWAGLRPQSADGLPYLGRAPAADNLYVAAGHFRAGLQLSPITATVMTQLLLEKPTTIPVGPYAVDRPAPESTFAIPGRH
jgi:glycine oxidase